MNRLANVLAAVALAALSGCGGGGAGSDGGGGSTGGGGSAGSSIPPLTNGFEVWDFSFTPVSGTPGRLCMRFTLGPSAGTVGASSLFVNGALAASDMTGTVNAAGAVSLASASYGISFSGTTDAAATTLSGTYAGSSVLGAGNFSGVRVNGKHGCFWEALGAALDISSGNDAWGPVIRVGADGNPVVAFIEEVLGTPVGGSTPYEQRVYVRRWTGSTWSQLGGALTTGSQDSTAYLRLALGADGNPVVAWGERDKGTLVYNAYVKRWTGSAWESLGATLNSPADRSTHVGGLTVDATGPVVAVSSYDSSLLQWETRILRWSSGSWSALGSTIFGYARDLALDPGDGQVGLVYADGLQSLWVTKWTGGSWGGGYGGPASFGPGAPTAASLAFRAGKPIVAYPRPSGFGSKVDITTTGASGWENYTPGVSITPTSDARAPQLALDPTDSEVVVGYSAEVDGGLTVKKGVGGAWRQLGGTIDSPLAFSAEPVALAFASDGRLFAAHALANVAGPTDVVVRVWPTPR